MLLDTYLAPAGMASPIFARRYLLSSPNTFLHLLPLCLPGRTQRTTARHVVPFPHWPAPNTPSIPRQWRLLDRVYIHPLAFRLTSLVSSPGSTSPPFPCSSLLLCCLSACSVVTPLHLVPRDCQYWTSSCAVPCAPRVPSSKEVRNAARPFQPAQPRPRGLARIPPLIPSPATEIRKTTDKKTSRNETTRSQQGRRLAAKTGLPRTTACHGRLRLSSHPGRYLAVSQTHRDTHIRTGESDKAPSRPQSLSLLERRKVSRKNAALSSLLLNSPRLPHPLP